MSETELRNSVSWNIKNDKWKLVFQFLAGLMEDKTTCQVQLSLTFFQ